MCVLRMYVYVGMCVCVRICTCVCMLVYIYIYIYKMRVFVVYCSYSEQRIPVDCVKCTYIVFHCGVISFSFDNGIPYF